jgi:hypothetical protein
VIPTETLSEGSDGKRISPENSRGAGGRWPSRL